MHLVSVDSVTLNLDRDKHRPCKVKGSSCVDAQVDVEVFRCNNSDGVASEVQRFKERECLLKSKAKTY